MLNHEKMKKYEDMLCRELDKIEMEIDKSGGITSGMLEAMHKITDTIKNLKKIEKLGSADYSGRRMYSGHDDGGYWEAQGSYDNDSYGDSYGRHWVRGHYSRDDAKNSMIERLEAVMNSATSERDRETIRNTINTLKSM